MASALFINGVRENVLDEIVKAQENGAGESYLQPHSGGIIRMLREQHPSSENPIRLYISTSDDLANVHYSAQIVEWADKREMSEDSKAVIATHLGKHQPNEVKLFEGGSEIGRNAVNLIKIRDLRKLGSALPTTELTKVSDGTPRKVRSQAGGWSEVYDIGNQLSRSPHRRREHLLDAIKAQHIRKGIELFMEGHNHEFGDSTKFDLLYENKFYPPKAIIGLAAVPLYGEALKPDDFTGGAGSKCFRVLTREGFQVVPKVSEFPPTADQEVLDRRTREALSAPTLPKPVGQKSPRQTSRETKTYERDPLVRAFVLRRAAGKCECCSEVAPFVDWVGEPFLEVHHVQPLADGGGDVVENAVAICPNCHRECHHGINAPLLRKHLSQIIQELSFQDVPSC